MQLKNSIKTYSIAVLLILFFNSRALAQKNIVFPPNSGVTNLLTDERYQLKPNDNSTEAANYNTTKIQQAIDDCKGKRAGTVSQLLYFPNGTYYVNKKITLGSKNGVTSTSREVIIQGQSKEGTVIRLKDKSDVFKKAETETPLLVFFEGVWNNNAMGNYVRDITFDIGADNPGATGIDFHNNNYGGISDVIIKTSDSQKRGKVGLKMTRELTGIGYIKNLSIEGFDYGIKTGSYIIDYVFEDLDLKGQRVAGLENKDKPLQIRRLHSINSVPAIINSVSDTTGDGIGHIVLIDSKLDFTGNPTSTIPAIDNRYGFLFARNITSNYPVIIRDSVGLKNRTTELTDDGEFSSKGVFRLWDKTPLKSMNMTIKDAPEVPWDNDFNSWAIVDPNANGDQDDTKAILDAINSGKSTVCIKFGTINLNNSIVFPDNHKVKRFLVLGQFKIAINSVLSTFNSKDKLDTKKPIIVIGTGLNDVLLIEGIRTTNDKYYQFISNHSKKTLILRHNALYGSNRIYTNTLGAGTLFIEDIATLAENPYGFQQKGTAFLFDHQEVYARSFNPENIEHFAVNNGGKLWVLGFKTEGTGICFETNSGGFTEILGGEVNGVFPGIHKEIIINNNSNVSVIALERARKEPLIRHEIIKEKRDIEKKLIHGDLPLIFKNDKFLKSTVIPLYVGYDPTKVLELSLFSAVPYFGNTSNYTPLNTSYWETKNFENGNRYFLNTAGNGISKSLGLSEYAIVNKKVFSDFSITLKAKSAEPAKNANANYAIMFAYTDAKNYYYLLMSRNKAETKIYQVINGLRQAVSQSAGDAGITTNTTFQSVSLTRTGKTIQVNKDNKSILSANIPGLTIDGSLGIGSQNSAVYFDEINVQ